MVLKEPSVVAYDRDADKIRAIGDEARIMLSRTTGNIVAIRPLKNGIIADYAVTEQMLKYFIQKATGRLSFRKPRISICVPSGEESCGRCHISGRSQRGTDSAGADCSGDWSRY